MILFFHANAEPWVKVDHGFKGGDAPGGFGLVGYQMTINQTSWKGHPRGGSAIETFQILDVWSWS